MVAGIDASEAGVFLADGGEGAFTLAGEVYDQSVPASGTDLREGVEEDGVGAGVGDGGGDGLE